MSDDRMLSRDELRILLPVFRTPTACSGAAAAYLLRRIAYRAGAYAPGIDDARFAELHTQAGGASIDHVLRWYERRRDELHAFGYRVSCACVARPATTLLDWIREARGYRGAVILVSHRTGSPARPVAVTVDRLDPSLDDELVMIDAAAVAERVRRRVPSVLELADRDGMVSALAMHWSGWS